MTEAPRVQPLAFADLAEAVAALRASGLRLTTPRRLVLEALFAADAPVSAEGIATVTGVEITSVYRNLEALEAHGIVQHVHLGHGPGLHALVGSGRARVPLLRAVRRCHRPAAGRSRSRAVADPRAVRVRGAVHPLRDRRPLRRLREGRGLAFRPSTQ